MLSLINKNQLFEEEILASKYNLKDSFVIFEELLLSNYKSKYDRYLISIFDDVISEKLIEFINSINYFEIPVLELMNNCSIEQLALFHAYSENSRTSTPDLITALNSYSLHFTLGLRREYQSLLEHFKAKLEDGEAV